MKVLKHFVLQSSWLQPQRVHKRAQAVPQQGKFCFPVEVVPSGEQFFPIPQLGFSFLPPIGAYTAWNHHTHESYKPEMWFRQTILAALEHCDIPAPAFM